MSSRATFTTSWSYQVCASKVVMIRTGLEIRDILELLELEHLHRESCAPDYTKIATHLSVCITIQKILKATVLF